MIDVCTPKQFEKYRAIYYGLDKMGDEKQIEASEKNVCLICLKYPKKYPKQNPQVCSRCFLHEFYTGDIITKIAELENLKRNFEFSPDDYAEKFWKRDKEKILDSIKKSNKRWKELGKSFRRVM